MPQESLPSLCQGIEVGNRSTLGTWNRPLFSAYICIFCRVSRPLRSFPMSMTDYVRLHPDSWTLKPQFRITKMKVWFEWHLHCLLLRHLKPSFSRYPLLINTRDVDPRLEYSVRKQKVIVPSGRSQVESSPSRIDDQPSGGANLT